MTSIVKEELIFKILSFSLSLLYINGSFNQSISLPPTDKLRSSVFGILLFL